MDPAAADQPCVIQALPANSSTLPPPLVQALPAAAAHRSPAKTNPNSNPPSSPAAAAAKRRPAPAPPGPAPPSPRRTRSGGAPEWTPAETLALVAEVAAVDDGWSRSVSAFQKWAMVAENLAASEAFASGGAGGRRGRGGKRAAGECRRRWEALAAEYGAVRRWEVRSGGTYWEMSAAARRKAGLPAEFDAEVYGAMEALLLVEEALLADAAGIGAGGEEVEGLVGGGAGVVVEVGEQDCGVSGEAEVGKEQVQEDASAGEEERQEEEEEEEEERQEEEEQQDEDDDEDEDEEEEEDEDEQGVDEEGEEMHEDGGNADASNELGHETGTSVEPEKSQNIAWELANKLHENAQHIHTILSEEADQNHAIGGLMLPDAMEATRQKADELIQSLGGLVSYLNQFTELVKETGFENIAGMT